MRYLSMIVALFMGALLLWGATDFPHWKDPNSPASSHPSVSQHYIQNAYADTNVPNLVTVVLADYRNFDTMFETTVVFTAGTAILLILRLPLAPLARRRSKAAPPLKLRGMSRDPILEGTARILFPVTHLFGLYVLAHGHHSPGGGFQAGVILGASFILLALCFDMRASLSRFSEVLFRPMSALGVCLYAGVGVLCMILGQNFLDYSALEVLAPWITPEMIRSHGILLVECGVTLTVAAVIFAIYINLASQGQQREGL